MLPCLIFEDDHLLVVNKPPGLNTHAPAPFSGEGIYDWLRHREPRWASLAIIHRLDKETSGVLLFAKTPLANRSLTEQFSQRAVRKKYLLLTDALGPERELTIKTSLVRLGAKYVSKPAGIGGELAITRFRHLGALGSGGPPAGLERAGTFPAGLPAAFQACSLVQAEPLTGRTHQVRVHAASSEFPILGDSLYGGSPASRLFLHAAELSIKHPVSNEEVTFRAPVDFAADPRLALRRALIDQSSTNAWRLIHGAADGQPGWYVERLGEFLLSQAAQPLSPEQREKLRDWVERLRSRGAYHKLFIRNVQETGSHALACPVLGEAASERFNIRENGLQFELSLNEGYSFGLFLDQRDNRHRLLRSHVAAGFSLFPGRDPSRPMEILNAFSYTSAFSVCAAAAGHRVTSLDLSRKYLDWGKRNFELNRLDPGAHEFIFGDVFDWFGRLARKRRRFDAIILDPPTFSRSKGSGVFRVEKDYGKLVAAALPLLASPGVLLASTNAAGWPAEQFVLSLETSIEGSKRTILQKHYAPQPPDFPVTRAEPAYLKTVWYRLK